VRNQEKIRQARRPWGEKVLDGLKWARELAAWAALTAFVLLSEFVAVYWFAKYKLGIVSEVTEDSAQAKQVRTDGLSEILIEVPVSFEILRGPVHIPIQVVYRFRIPNQDLQGTMVPQIIVDVAPSVPSNQFPPEIKAVEQEWQINSRFPNVYRSPPRSEVTAPDSAADSATHTR
jgi:hypothetical protein